MSNGIYRISLRYCSIYFDTMAIICFRVDLNLSFVVMRSDNLRQSVQNVKPRSPPSSPSKEVMLSWGSDSIYFSLFYLIL